MISRFNNHKLKLIVSHIRYYRAHWTKSVDAIETLFIPGAKHSTLSEGWMRFEPLTLFVMLVLIPCQGTNSIKKFKPMVVVEQ